MKFLNVLLAVAVSALIGLGVFEGGLRLIGLGPPATLNEFDPDLGWRKRADASVRKRGEGFDVTLRTNGLGLRDDADQTVAKPEGVFRVLALGDSFTLGYTVDREHLFVDLLEDAWKVDGKKVEVVNVGTEGYSTDQSVAWLETHGAAWQPDAVLLFPYDNDLYYNGSKTYARFPKPRYTPEGVLEDRELEDPGPRSLAQRTAIGRLLVSEPGLPRFQTAEGAWLLCEFAPLLDEPPAFLEEESLPHTRGAFQALARLSAELGAPALVVPVPSQACVQPDYAEFFGDLLKLAPGTWSPDRPVDLTLDAARAAGLPVLDVREAMRAASAALAREGEPTSGDLHFRFPEFHLNPAGNRALATAVAGAAPGLLAEPLVAPAELAAAAPVTEGGGRVWPYWFAGLWLVLGLVYARTYREQEPPVLGFLKVGGMLAVIFAIAIGGSTLIAGLDPKVSQFVLIGFLVLVIGFVAYKLGDRIGTIGELLGAFTLRGHWYLMPLLVVLLTVGSLLVVAASSPLVAPFIYTLF